MKDGFIYIVESQQGQFKIGWSTSPQRRADHINSHSPIPCRLIAIVEGTMKEEHALHKRFEASGSHSEWYFSTPEVLQFIRSVRWQGCPESDFPNRLTKYERYEKARVSKSKKMKAVWADPEYRKNLERMKKRRAEIRAAEAQETA